MPISTRPARIINGPSSEEQFFALGLRPQSAVVFELEDAEKVSVMLETLTGDDEFGSHQFSGHLEGINQSVKGYFNTRRRNGIIQAD